MSTEKDIITLIICGLPPCQSCLSGFEEDGSRISFEGTVNESIFALRQRSPEIKQKTYEL